ncbi:ABC transporter ATP-binding protein [Natronosporangium hydrolyticum]|uniref:ABC transporter ATP-binding protein n=1 Tax=Natronosporangium hydrolyticum TaxID=2811111 RepID=A0A895Y4I5_9ACTN|nr:ABC transporter ATP-binding protein [Natronosporangium hydrolyticum]QSB12614.1 ABC transporter ATP-binding protein [Natronosporangium hydrolyticum]
MTELQLDRISVRLGGVEIVRDLALRAGSGEVIGLVGPNGSGKSTALRCVYRAVKPSGGTIRVGGHDLLQLPPRFAAQQVAALTQEGGSDLDFTVGELIALGRAPYQRGNQPLTARERQLCHEAMVRTDVVHLADRGVLGLSGGERQRVLLARALVQEPKVLLLDEPTNHLDLRHQIALLSYLRTAGTTTVVVLHDLNFAAATCDRLGMLHHGALVAVGTPAEVLTAERIAAVYGVDVVVTDHPLTGAPQLLFSLDGTPGSRGPAVDAPVSPVKGQSSG